MNESTPFYSDYGLSMIKFYLPYTYFVKVVDAQAEVTRVIYMDGQSNIPLREGYIKTCDLFLFDGEPTNPYPEVNIKITSDEVLFADSQKQYPKTVLTSGDLAVYYGDLTDGNEKFCYVYCNGYVGYVRKSAFAPFEIPRHSLPLTPEIPDPPISSEVPIESDNGAISGADDNLDSTMRIIVIIAVALTCVSVIYLLFKPKQTTDFKVAPWRDEDDFD